MKSVSWQICDFTTVSLGNKEVIMNQLGMLVMCWINVGKGKKNLYKLWNCVSSLLSVVENVCPEKKFILKVSAFKLSNIADNVQLLIFIHGPGGGEFFHTRPDWPWGLPSLLCNGYQVSHRDKAARAWHWPPTPI
jgi:hypothetical protein